MDKRERALMASLLAGALQKRTALEESGRDVYASLEVHPELVYSTTELEVLLSRELIGQVFDAPIRTRAKLAKQAAAKALGYPVPPTLRKTKPRFPGQDLDVYVQQSDNLQIWNDEVSPTRRYAVLGVDQHSRVYAVRVPEGTELALFDRTGTLTSKFQAKRLTGRSGSDLVVTSDTGPFIRELAPVELLDPGTLISMQPANPPTRGRVLAIQGLYHLLLGMVGMHLPDSPSERRRGEGLHRAACTAIGLAGFADAGTFPDIPCQALEVKLQTASTIDLGLVSPDSEQPALTLSPRLRHCDTRYLIAYAERRKSDLVIREIVLSTGEAFHEEFRQFGGLGQNKKLQLRLPRGFFHTK